MTAPSSVHQPQKSAETEELGTGRWVSVNEATRWSSFRCLHEIPVTTNQFLGAGRLGLPTIYLFYSILTLTRSRRVADLSAQPIWICYTVALSHFVSIGFSH